MYPFWGKVLETMIGFSSSFMEILNYSIIANEDI
jgi:hypothetical protein